MRRLFSFQGIIRRLPYFAFVVMFWPVTVTAVTMLTATVTHSMPVTFITIFGLIIVAIISVYCLSVQRLHDISLTGWLALLPHILGAILYAKNPQIRDQIKEHNFSALDLFDIGILCCISFYMLFLFVWPGYKGENRYEYE